MFAQGHFTHITLQEFLNIETLQQIKFIDVQILRTIVQQSGVNNLAYTYSNKCGRKIRVQLKQVNYTRLFCPYFQEHWDGPPFLHQGS